MKSLWLRSLLLFSILFFSCFDEDSTNIKKFWVIDSTLNFSYDSSGWYQVNAEKVATGDHCLVYLEEGSSIADDTINDLVLEFDTKIWTSVTDNFASPSDVDGNNRIILLLMDIKDGYNGVDTTMYLGGYFFYIDLFSEESLPGLGCPDFYHTNKAEILYIDIDPNDPGSTTFKSTVAHEFQHLVNFGQNVIIEGGDPLPTWIDEGLATTAEAIYQQVDLLFEREQWYDSDPLHTGQIGNYSYEKVEAASLSAGYPLVIWNPYYDKAPMAVLNNYALSHLFFAWLRIHKGSDNFFKQIINSPHNDFSAVLDVCGALGNGDEVETSAKMVQKFYMANLLGGNGKQSGLDSYLGKNFHKGPYVYSGAGRGLDLYPGGAVHFINTNYNNWSPTGGDSAIVYSIADVVNYSDDYSAPFGTGAVSEVLLVVNSKTSGESTSKTASLFDSNEVLLRPSQETHFQVVSESSRSTGTSQTPKAHRIGIEYGLSELPFLNQ